MRRAERMAGGRPGEQPAPAATSAVGGGVVFGGDNAGIASTGAYATNTLIQYQVVAGAADFRPVTELQPREVPVLSTFPERDPAGRTAIVEQVAGELVTGTSVQLYGPAGVGKKAIARAVIRRLGMAPDPVHGIEVLPRPGQPHTLDSLYEHLATALFHGATYEPAESLLRAAVAAAGLSAVIVIGDCALPAPDLTRLLGTFPGCVFLLTSVHQTLYRTGAVHEIGPVSLPAAMDLIAQETGQEPTGLRRLQAAEAYKMAAGQTQRLLQYAAFLRFSASQPGQDPLSLIPPVEQAKILAAGLSEPARCVLVALRTFGTDLVTDCFAAVTGLPEQPATGPPLREAGPELLAAALVTRADATLDDAARSGRAGTRSFAYRITPDAAAAVDALGWDHTSAETAGRGLLSSLTGSNTMHPSPALLLAVATKLSEEGSNGLASQFIRAAMPCVLTSGPVRTWIRLARLGIEAATSAGADDDLAYFLHEASIWRRMHAEKIAAALAAAGTAELGAQHHVHVAQTHAVQTHAVRHSARALRRILHYCTAHPVAAAGTTAAAVATAAVGVVVIAHAGGHALSASLAADPCPGKVAAAVPSGWVALPNTSITKGADGGTCVQSGSLYWGGIYLPRIAANNYTVAVTGRGTYGWGVAARVTVTAATVTGHAIQYENVSNAYRDVDYPGDTGPWHAIAVNARWHTLAVTVRGNTYILSLDGRRVVQGTLPQAAEARGGAYIRVWSGGAVEIGTPSVTILGSH